jgi:hypothetical protein
MLLPNMSQFNVPLAQCPQCPAELQGGNERMVHEGGGPGLYVIMLKQALIAQDVAEAIAQHEPGAKVIIARDDRSAVDALDGRGPLKAVFVDTGPQDFADMAIAAVALAAGALVILTGEAAEQAASGGWLVLRKPFTDEQLLDLLRLRL